MYFPNYCLRNTLLDKCLKNPASEGPLKGTMVNGSKHCYNLNNRTFTIFIDQSEGNCVGKGLF